MAIYLNNNVGVKLATAAAPTTPSVDISSLVTNAVINQIVDELEVTAMGDSSHRYVKGLESATITVSFLNDQATGEVLATLNAAYGTTVAWKAINNSTVAVGAENLLYSGDLLVNNLTPINGGVGDMSTMDITFTVNSSVTAASTGTF